MIGAGALMFCDLYTGFKEDLEASGYLAETEFVRELKEREQSVLIVQEKYSAILDEKEHLLNQIVQLE